jgi:hypothetical protein
VANTRARLAELYGAAHTFELRDAEGGGVIVEVTLPVAPGTVALTSPGPPGNIHPARLRQAEARLTLRPRRSICRRTAI